MQEVSIAKPWCSRRQVHVLMLDFAAKRFCRCVGIKRVAPLGWSFLSNSLVVESYAYLGESKDEDKHKKKITKSAPDQSLQVCIAAQRVLSRGVSDSSDSKTRRLLGIRIAA